MHLTTHALHLHCDCQLQLSAHPMPPVTKRKRWLHEIGDHHREVQQARLEDALHSDDSSISESSSIASDDEPMNPYNPVDLGALQADLLNLNDDLEMLKLELETELLDLELSLDEPDFGMPEQYEGSQPPSPTSSEILDEVHERYTDRLAGLLNMLANARVFDPKPPNPKASQLHLLDHWQEHDIRNFRAKLRVHPLTFCHILDLIKDHPIFHNNLNSAQMPVDIQLAVYLVRAGHYGNSSAVSEVAIWAGVSVGFVRKATLRVMIALISLHDTAIHLPTDDEKAASKKWVENACCPEWRNGFLAVDGTKFPFFQRPGLHGDAWFNKNKDYSADCQV